MNPATWQQVSALFADCLQRSPIGRELLLASLEGSQPDVVNEVRALLSTYEEDRGFLETPAEQQVTESLTTGGESEEHPSTARPTVWGWLRSRPAPFHFMVIAEMVAIVCYVVILVLFARYAGLSTNLGWDCDTGAGGCRVDRVDIPGPAAGILEDGDLIRTFKQSPAGGTGILRDLDTLAPGERYCMVISRKGTERRVDLTNEIVRKSPSMPSVAAYLLVSIAFFLAAVVMGALKPGERITQLAWAALLAEALSLLGSIMNPYADFLTGPSRIFHQTLELIDGPHFALAYHFYTRLFARNPRQRDPTIILFYVAGCLVPLTRLAEPILPGSILTPFFVAEPAYYSLAPLAICATVLRNYLTVKDPDAHLRLRWVVFGSLIGILPYAVVKAFGVALPFLNAQPWLYEAYALVVSLAVIPAAIIPFATGYAILEHRLFGIDVVLRRGVQYLLAKNMLRIVLALPAAGLLYALIANRRRTVADVALHNGLFIAAAILIAIVMRYRERLGTWLDRKFFRESYRKEHLLSALAESVKKLNSAPEMCRLVGEQIMTALHPENAAVFFRSRQERVFLCGFSSDDRSSAMRVGEESTLASILRIRSEPLDITSLRKKSGQTQAYRWLDRLGVDLVAPIAQTDGTLAGFMLLGRKRSEELYTPADRSLLAALAEQMGMVIENLWLQDRLRRQQEAGRQMRAQAADAGSAWLLECPACGRCFDGPERTCPEDGNELVSSLPVPRLVDGRYRLDRALGRGGMGVVYRAWDERLRRDVAVKLVLPGILGDAAALKRFVREAHALARVSHPNIVATHDFGVIEGEVAWIVMEFVSGSTLRSEISGGAIRPTFAAHWLSQLLDGVHAAHEAGIVHRDLKPENVLVSHPIHERSQVKIADFGIARWSAPDLMDSTLTVPGTLLGSIHYMSPEQLTGEPVDKRTDIFSAGVIIFEVLAGRLPFSGKTPAERIVSILNDDRRFESALPGATALHSVLDKCLAKDPGQRYESAAALKQDLIPLLAGPLAAGAR